MGMFAKSGLGSVQQHAPEFLIIPNIGMFLATETFFQSIIVKGLGYSKVRCGVLSSNTFILRVMQGNSVSTTFAAVTSLNSADDPVLGVAVQAADLDAAITRAYIRIRVEAPSGLGGNFQVGAHLLPHT